MLQMQHYVALMRFKSKGYPKLGEHVSDLIINEIIAAGKNGIYQNDLSSRINVDRTTVYRATNKYKEQKKIKIKTEGRRTKYIIANGVYIDAGIAAYLINRKYVSSVIGEKDFVLPKFPGTYTHVDEDISEYIDFTTYKDYYEPKFTKQSELEESFFEFANQIGAYVLYLFIQFMNPENSLTRTTSLFDNGEDKVDIVLEWIRNSISLAMPEMLIKFRNKCLKNMLEKSVVIPKTKHFSPYQFDKGAIIQLLKAFSRLYPRIYYTLEEIMNDLPAETNSHKEFLMELDETYKQQEVCIHKWNKPNMKLGIKQCKICKLIKGI